MPDAARPAYEVYANEMDPAAEAEAEALLRVLADARLAAPVRTNHRPDAPPDERSTRKKKEENPTSRAVLIRPGRRRGPARPRAPGPRQ